MIPTLPTKLIAHIQVLAEDGEEPSERLRIRSRFERVSKSWYNMIDYFTNLIIIKTTDVTRLSKKMSNKKMRDLVGAKTRSIFFSPAEFHKAPTMKKLTGLLKWLVNVESIKIDRTGGWIDLSGSAPRKGGHSGKALFDALSKLSKVKHFTLLGDPNIRGMNFWKWGFCGPQIGPATFEL